MKNDSIQITGSVYCYPGSLLCGWCSAPLARTRKEMMPGNHHHMTVSFHCETPGCYREGFPLEPCQIRTTFTIGGSKKEVSRITYVRHLIWYSGQRFAAYMRRKLA